MNPQLYLIILSTLNMHVTLTAQIELINGGYEGIVVAISPNIQESQAKEVILAIKVSIIYKPF